MDSKQPVARKVIAETFQQIADDILSGNYGKKIRIGLTNIGSEHSDTVMLQAAQTAVRKDSNLELVLIGKEEAGFENYPADSLEAAHCKMTELLESGDLSGCVSLHYDFPIGTSTVGKIYTPVFGKEMFLATTTGTTSINRVEAMVCNTIIGIAAAKASGIANPTVGILNIEGARQTEKVLKELINAGYTINFADSMRADGGAVMRGNDLLAATPDVMVCDSLTGNLLVKVFSSFNSGGSYETTGAGYGPGLPGKPNGFDKLINIISRASGAPQIAGAIAYCADCARNDVLTINNQELALAEKAGLSKFLEKYTAKKGEAVETVSAPAKEIVTYQISGIDILEIEDACQKLWKAGIYAETGMGCTGPVVLVNDANSKKAEEILR